MKGIIIVGHGEMPLAMTHSVKMIAGDLKNVFAVSLQADDGQEQFSKRFKECISKMDDYSKIIVFTDLIGGSPGNYVVSEYMNDARFEIISGVNLAMVLTAIMDNATNEMIVKEGKNGITDLKAKTVPISNVKKDSTKQNGKRVICGVRVDARGIHGQVATQWIPGLDIDRIMVIDDVIVLDDTQKSALKMAKPNHVKLSILSSAKAFERLSDESAYVGEKILIILTRVKTIDDLSKLNYFFKEVNLGNIPNRHGTKKYLKTIYLTKEEVSIIKNAKTKGTHFIAQMVPNDQITDFDNLIK
ncbi:MAG: PTS mannose/fructose/sorbose transporter subunit IIAB [Anaerorhabdus sp.]